MAKLYRLIRDERAVSAVEYSLIVALIVLAMIAGLVVLGSRTTGLWTNVSTSVATAS